MPVKSATEIFRALAISYLLSYDFTIGVIKSYYDTEFIVDGKEYAVLDVMNTIVDQYKTKDTLPIPEIFLYMLACLFRIHYALYISS
ncbi:MAG: hypothetical protein E7168_04175 [Firmicutes bacterium]|nr:hypothetical protein [Bacillota bacterium]